jgi:hypothetical protein
MNKFWTDVDMDTRSGEYFVTDTDGYVYSARVTTSGISSPSTILTPGHLDGVASRVSVDWLSKQLYVLSGPELVSTLPLDAVGPNSTQAASTSVKEKKGVRSRQQWQVWRCGYDGKTGLEVVLRDFRPRSPLYIGVDPFFG